MGMARFWTLVCAALVLVAPSRSAVAQARTGIPTGWSA